MEGKKFSVTKKEPSVALRSSTIKTDFQQPKDVKKPMTRPASRDTYNKANTIQDGGETPRALKSQSKPPGLATGTKSRMDTAVRRKTMFQSLEVGKGSMN